MKRILVPAALAMSLLVGCSEDSTSLGSSNDTELQISEESAVIVAESVALESGGLLETLEASIVETEEEPDFLGLGLKDRVTDDASFDSTTCTWTLSWNRTYEGPFTGFNWSQTRTLRMMDELGDCIVEPDGDGSIKALDLTREFSGNSWNRRHEGQKNGWGDWQIRELNDGLAGARVNGSHHAEGTGTVSRTDEDGEPVEIEHSFNLDVQGDELLVVRRPSGRRVPIEGTLYIVYDAARGDRSIHREITITFGADGASIDFGDDLQYQMDPVTGELLN